MTRLVHCAKLNIDTEGLDAAPFPGAVGRKIFEQISKEAWGLWVAHQTMLINENGLNALDPKSRTFLSEEREKFLFGAGSALPPGYKPPAA